MFPFSPCIVHTLLLIFRFFRETITLAGTTFTRMAVFLEDQETRYYSRISSPISSSSLPEKWLKVLLIPNTPPTQDSRRSPLFPKVPSENIRLRCRKIATKRFQRNGKLEHSRVRRQFFPLHLANYIPKGSAGSAVSQRQSSLPPLPPPENLPPKTNYRTPQRVVLGDKLPPVVQCAAYAVEMLSHSPWINYVVNSLIIGMSFVMTACPGRSFHKYIADDHIWLWWYDRQGAIQSTGFNYIQHLPYYLLILLCFQRFDLKAWGFNTELFDDGARDNSVSGYYTGTQAYSSREANIKSFELLPGMEKKDMASQKAYPSPDDEENRERPAHPPERITVGLKHPLEERFCLIGRGTRVLLAYFDENKKAWSHVTKFSWQEITREPEDKVVLQALEDAESRGDKRVLGHLPVITHSYTCGHNTADIREMLRVTWPREAKTNGRTLRVIVEEILFPLTKLKGEEFMLAFLECIQYAYQ